jgi:glycosyltransferase involved in cell wall biosynthesis
MPSRGERAGDRGQEGDGVLRILHVSRSAETLRAFLIPTMEAERALGHEVMVCAQESPQAERLREAGFEVFTHRMPRNVNPFPALGAILAIRRVLLTRHVDMIVCHTSLGALVGRLAAWWAGTPRVVYFVHGLACGPAQSALSWRVRFGVERLLARVTDAIVVMNDYDERLSIRAPLARSAAGVVRIAAMGVDLKRHGAELSPAIRERLTRELGLGRGVKLVLSTARLIPEKGVGEFIEAACRICGRRDDVVFALAGTGPLHEALVARVRRAGLESRVRVLGWRDDVPELMKLADIFSLPSYFMEGLPVSILEAMACAKPVVSTHHKGCEDAVADGETGLLVPVRKVEPLMDATIRLLDDEMLRARLGRAGRSRAADLYEIGACTRRIVDVLEAVLHSRRESSGRPAAR